MFAYQPVFNMLELGTEYVFKWKKKGYIVLGIILLPASVQQRKRLVLILGKHKVSLESAL